MRRELVLLLCTMGVAAGAGGSGAQTASPPLTSCVITIPAEPRPLESLAAREVRRYIYLRTGRLVAVTCSSPNEVIVPAHRIVISHKGRLLLTALSGDTQLAARISALEPQQYWLKTIPGEKGWTLLLTGGDEVGTLYAAYRLAEHLGVRFYLEGDVVPDDRAAAVGLPSSRSRGAEALLRPLQSRPGLLLPNLDEQCRPLFALRGIQPFHDFPEGPDWWNQDDYLAILSQLPKLRMNFFGLHTYPEGGPNAEPTVWIGLPESVGPQGAVKSSYAASYQNTLRGNWGYQAKPTCNYTFGTDQLFERDGFGAGVMADLCPQPTNTTSANALFERTGAMLRAAFRHANDLGIKTCVGTETPLTIPKQVQEQLKRAGLNPTNSATVQKLYEGMFKRICETYPLDYFWFWTPETWTWESVKAQQVAATTNDLALALKAAQAVRAPFKLATCGWVLGPPEDRALFDKILPKDWPVSCINREVGKWPVELGFAAVSGRSKWAIPWLEDDPALTSPQLWVGRMRQDAVDALRYGCDGLMGIHWRTRVLGPNVSALAQAAWDQTPWRREESRVSGWIGGQTSTFPTNRIGHTQAAPLYQSVRYSMSSYRFAVPPGSYQVTLKFCEPHFDAVGKRVFSVKIQGKKILDRLDIFAIAGKNNALDYTFDHLQAPDGWLNLEFLREVENPAIAAIVVQGNGFTQKVNCGGPAYADYSADLPPLPRYQATRDFYVDWASHQFGPGIAEAAADILVRIDGQLPRPSDWIDGPGGLKPDTRPWEKVAKEYAYADQFQALRRRVRGAGNLARFDYWAHTFQYMKAMACLNCSWGELNRALDSLKDEKDVTKKARFARSVALPKRQQLARCLGEVYAHLLALVSTPGELGTVANWEQHIQPKLVTAPGETLAKALGEPLPTAAQLPRVYRGPLRVIVPTQRTSLRAGEDLRLKVLVLAGHPPKEVTLYWRALAGQQFRKVPLTHVARGVYTVQLSADQVQKNDFEYYVRVTPKTGAAVCYPATAPTLNQTVVIQPAG